MRYILQLVGWILVMLCAAIPAYGDDFSQLDRGHRLLLHYGYQLHAAPSPALPYRNPNGIDSTNLTVWRNANFNGLNFESTNWDGQMWTPPTGNYNWSRWEIDTVNPTNPAHMGMVMVSVLEEQELDDPNIVNTMAQRIASIRESAPNVIGYVNDAGITNPLADIQNYMAVAKPDILSFDHYVFGFGDPWEGGSPTPLYSTMGKYRTAALGGHNGDSTKPIPYGMWTQMFKVAGRAALSESEMSLQYGAAWAYGYTSLHAFRYSSESPDNTLPSALFDGPNDSNPTPLYDTVARLNQQTQNLAPALLRLKSTNLQFVRGLHKEGTFNFSNDLPQYTTSWNASADGNPYLTGITATNAGNPNGAPKKNDELRGDVIVGHFTPLAEGFDGPDHNNQVYFMITNGLTDAIGNSADTRQLVRLNFNFGASGINSLQRLDRDSGQVVNVPLVSTGGSNYSLDWYLNGGEGDLFKYNTGAPFVGTGATTKILFQDNFQDHSVGEALHNKRPTIGEGYSWQGANHYGYIDDNMTNPPGGTGGEKFVGGLPSLNGYGQQNAVITAADEIAATSQVVQFNLDAYVVSTATQQGGLDLSTFASGGAYVGRAWDINLQTDGTISIYDDNGYNNVAGGTFRTDTWVPVEVIADYAAGTFQATVDGFAFEGNFSTSAGNNSFRRVSISEIGNAPAFIDNLLVTIPGIGGVSGDYNADGAVNAADYVVWRNGEQPLKNEVATLGTTDAQDYSEWRKRFGNSATGGIGSAGSGVGAAPEPTTALMVGVATIFLSVQRAYRDFATLFAPTYHRRDSL